MRDLKEHAGASGLPRMPAAELESAVLDQLRNILRAPNLLSDLVPQAKKLDPTLDEAKVTVAMTRLDLIWDQLFPAEQTRIVKMLIEKVIVSPSDLEVRLRANGIEPDLIWRPCPPQGNGFIAKFIRSFHKWRMDRARARMSAKMKMEITPISV